MQPCSQPWYGLIDCVNGISGESLRAMIVRAAWMVTIVLRGGSSSPSVSVPGCQRSSQASRESTRKRFAGLNVAPRPLTGGSDGVRAVMRFPGRRNETGYDDYVGESYK